MSTQPEALRLAEWLEHQVPMTPDLRAQASAELRRLHEVEVAYGVMMAQAESRIAELREMVDALNADRDRLMELNDPAVTYCHRFAILMECVMLGGVDKYWDEMGTLLDEYHKARDAWMTAHGQPYVSGFGKD
jgi:hypothetical protein